MKKIIQASLSFILLLTVSACSSTSSTQTNFTYPSAMTLGYLPLSNIRTLFVANTFTGTISEINTATNSVMPITTPAGTNALQMNMYPKSLAYNDSYLYVAGFTQATGLLESLNLLTNQTTSTVYLRGYPLKTLLIPQTSTLFVLDAQNDNFYLESFTVSNVITPSTFTSLTFTPSSMMAGPDNRELFVSSNDQPFISVLDPDTLIEMKRIATDHPVSGIGGIVNQYANTMLYAMVYTSTGYAFESINTANGTMGYEFTVPGIPYDLTITPQRVALDDDHFSYLGIVANANGYIHFLNIDHGCNIPLTPSSYTGLRLTSSIPASMASSIQSIITNDCTTQSETWTVVYNSGAKNYTVAGTVSGLQANPARNGTFFDSINDGVSFYINPGTTALNNNDMFTFNTIAAQNIKILTGIGFPENVIMDQITNQAYITDILTNSIYVISPATQSIIATIK